MNWTWSYFLVKYKNVTKSLSNSHAILLSQNIIYMISRLNVSFHKVSWQLNDSELRRSEKIENIAGLTKLAGENIDEFVVHIKNGYDWRLKSQR